MPIVAVLWTVHCAPGQIERQASYFSFALMLAGIAAAAGLPLSGPGGIVTQTGYQLWFLIMPLSGLRRSSNGGVA